jgi:hypothetical protein
MAFVGRYCGNTGIKQVLRLARTELVSFTFFVFLTLGGGVGLGDYDGSHLVPFRSGFIGLARQQ